MFRSVFQGGDCVEVLSAKGKDGTKHWKLSDRTGREFDSTVKSYVVNCGASASPQLEAPPTPRQTLGLVQPFLCLQLLLDLGNSMFIELHGTDAAGGKLRVLLSSAFKVKEANPLHTKLPLDGPGGVHVPRGSWTNFVIDLVAVFAECGRPAAFQSLDAVSLHAACKVRSVFTLKHAPFAPGVAESYSDVSPIPRSVEFPAGTAYSTVVYRPNFVVSAVSKPRVASNRPSIVGGTPSRPTRAAPGHRASPGSARVPTIPQTPPRSSVVVDTPARGASPPHRVVSARSVGDRVHPHQPAVPPVIVQATPSVDAATSPSLHIQTKRVHTVVDTASSPAAAATARRKPSRSPVAPMKRHDRASESPTSSPAVSPIDALLAALNNGEYEGGEESESDHEFDEQRQSERSENDWEDRHSHVDDKESDVDVDDLVTHPAHVWHPSDDDHWPDDVDDVNSQGEVADAGDDEHNSQLDESFTEDHVPAADSICDESHGDSDNSSHGSLEQLLHDIDELEASDGARGRSTLGAPKESFIKPLPSPESRLCPTQDDDDLLTDVFFRKAVRCETDGGSLTGTIRTADLKPDFQGFVPSAPDSGSDRPVSSGQLYSTVRRVDTVVDVMQDSKSDSPTVTASTVSEHVRDLSEPSQNSGSPAHEVHTEPVTPLAAGEATSDVELPLAATTRSTIDTGPVTVVISQPPLTSPLTNTVMSHTFGSVSSTLPPDLQELVRKQKEIEDRLARLDALDDILPQDYDYADLDMGDSLSEVFSMNASLPRPHTSRTDSLGMTAFRDRSPLEEESRVMFGTMAGRDSRGIASQLGHTGQRPTSQQSQHSDSRMKLIYDPILRCYFDPVANKYYELCESTK